MSKVSRLREHAPLIDPGLSGTSVSAAIAASEPDRRALDRSIPTLVAQVYEAAPAEERGRLLEQLMRPLGVLSIFGIAGGVFASIRLRSGWPELKVRLEDIQDVGAAQVMALVDHAQQVSVETVDALAQMLVESPVLSSSAAAAVLVAMLVQRARSRQFGAAGTDADAPR